MEPTVRTLERIAKLKDPATLDKLLDAFQEMGLPMGSSRWADHCHAFLKQRQEESRILQRVNNHLSAAQVEFVNGADWFWRDIQTRLTREHQNEEAVRNALPKTEEGGS